MVTNLARLFSGLGKGKNDLGRRRLLSRSWSKGGFLKGCLRDFSVVLKVEGILDFPPL